MKSVLLTKFLAMSLVFFLAGTSFAQPGRIRFARGKTSAVINARLEPQQQGCYYGYAKRGQFVRAVVRSRGNVIIGDTNTRVLSYRITESGDQNFCVYNRGNRTTDFSLTVSIR